MEGVTSKQGSKIHVVHGLEDGGEGEGDGDHRDRGKTKPPSELVLDAGVGDLLAPWKEKNSLEHEEPEKNNLNWGLGHSCDGFHFSGPFLPFGGRLGKKDAHIEKGGN